MKKYRIKEITNGNGDITYKAQVKGLLFWSDLTYGWGYKQKSRANEEIEHHKVLLKNMQITSVKYHEVEL